MNERIRELYKQAHSVRHYDGDPALDGNPPTVYWQDEVSAQRFAELLIRECMSVIGEENYGMLTGKANCTKIKRHFGVEE